MNTAEATNNNVATDHSLNSLAQELYNKYHNIDTALDDMVKIVVADPVLASEIIRYGCRQYLSNAQGFMRAESYHGIPIGERRNRLRAVKSEQHSAQAPEYHSRRVEALGRMNLMNFPLSNGTLLRNATKAQLQKQAERYYNVGRDGVEKAKWLNYVASGLRATERVGQHYNEEDLRRLKEKAIKEVNL
jgi:hypothetical protein